MGGMNAWGPEPLPDGTTRFRLWAPGTPQVVLDCDDTHLPMTPQDVVLIFCTVKGKKDGHYVEMTDARKVYSGTFRGQSCSAIQTTTAAALCAVFDMHVAGLLPSQGFVRQEQVPLDDFLANRFGCSYDVNKK